MADATMTLKLNTTDLLAICRVQCIARRCKFNGISQGAFYCMRKDLLLTYAGCSHYEERKEPKKRRARK